jgi:peptidoglycan/LPS O-acetylase OafA/YrhL
MDVTPKTNNFDLIRLAAALQVAYQHSTAHFGTLNSDRPFSTLVTLFPGLPVFFFISGYLISKSFEKNSNWREYAWNRALRIYPALVVCFLVSLAAIWLCGYFTGRDVPRSKFIEWVVAQLTIGQFYSPAFMSHLPASGLNGSVWTITIELQFYVLVPVVYALLRLGHVPLRRANLILLSLIAAFLIASEVWTANAPHMPGGLGRQLFEVSFMPWIYMFLVGVFFQRNSVALQRWLAGRFLYLVLAYVPLAVVAVRELHWPLNNAPQPALFLGLALITFAAAFSAPALSERLLCRNDVSYGLYIYHVPVINVLLMTGAVGGRTGVAVALALSIALAYASWRVVEKPALTLKRHPLYQHRPAAAHG